MNIPVEFFILVASVISGSAGFIIASIFATARMRGLYNRGWNAGRDFATRHLHDTIIR